MNMKKIDLHYQLVEWRCFVGTACPLGHHGPFCRKQCEYPYYGKDCGDGVCGCEKEICNFATGCQQTTEGNLKGKKIIWSCLTIKKSDT